MTTDPTIRDQSYAYFLQEAPELLHVLEQELLNLRENWSINKVHTLMRTTHTLKGAAASVGLESIKSVAHSLEDIFKVLCKPNTTIDAETEALLREGYECLRIPLMAELTGSQTDHSDVFDRAAVVFTQLQEKLGDCFGEEAYLPTSEELGFDVTQSIFEVGVAQRLEQIAEAIATGDPQAVTDSLQTQAEVFLGLAQSLNLPGFGDLAQATTRALTSHPDQVMRIAEAAWADFQQAQADVLAGDRSCGGTLNHLQQWITEAQLEQDREPEAEPLDLSIQAIDVGADEIDEEAFLELWSAPSAEAPPPREPVSPAPTVRIEVEHLERLNYLAGELLTNQNRQSLQDEQLQRTVQTLLARWGQHRHLLARLKLETSASSSDEPSFVEPLLDSAEGLEVVFESLDALCRRSSQVGEKQRILFTSTLDRLLEARMMPLGEIFSRLPPLLQQLETLHHKPVTLTLHGRDILLDKAVAEKLYDPLLHLVRNAFDHGIELPEVRQQRGKAQTGTIDIRAYYQGSHLTIEVRDDGQGINYERIRQRAGERLMSPQEAAQLDEAQLMDILFEPGFSTTEQVNNLSGRGIGLDAVRAHIESLQGAVSVYSEPQRGTTFVLQIPFSLTMSKLLLAQTGSTTYAFLTDAVEQVLVPQPHQIFLKQGVKALKWRIEERERLIGIYRLEQLLSYSSPTTTPDTGPVIAPAAMAAEPGGMVILLRSEEQLLGIEVDQIIGEQELVIRPLGAAIVPPPYVYGGSILPDGRLTLAIDGGALAKQALERNRPQKSSVSQLPILPSEQRPIHTLRLPEAESAATVLLVDDSLTLRQNLALTLEKFGFQVMQAEDGDRALQTLQNAEIHVVVCDLEMPHMNGFEFLRTCQQSPTLANIPVVILTSKTEQQHRLMALELGAAAYLNKPCPEQQLLATVTGLLTQ
ncbi:MAG: response regulator [Cyanophyceae cyanobacterium]